MQILATDVGTGTQDILLFDSERTPENCLKLVMPSPTLLIGEHVRAATKAGRPLLITGVLMGGGPVSWAVEDHRRAGLRVFATPDAARTFNDDLDRVQREMGVEILSTEEARQVAARGECAHIEFRDFDYPAIRQAFAAFGLDLRPDALALAVFDHGEAPPDISDRQFRMDYLAGRLRADPRLSSLAYGADAVPESMTRLRALADTAIRQSGLPVYVMDTAPAAVLGALDDPTVTVQPAPLVVNVGNFHTLAFQFRDHRFVRLFEHHTGEITRDELAAWLTALADGSIRHESVFADNGHGALVLDDTASPLTFVAVVGPRRSLLHGSDLPSYYASPHGDQMLTGCFGLLRACADLIPAWQQEIDAALSGRTGRSLW
jgi:uncharacterized protein (DUF1786 family)